MSTIYSRKSDTVGTSTEALVGTDTGRNHAVRGDLPPRDLSGVAFPARNSIAMATKAEIYAIAPLDMAPAVDGSSYMPATDLNWQTRRAVEIARF